MIEPDRHVLRLDLFFIVSPTVQLAYILFKTTLDYVWLFSAAPGQWRVRDIFLVNQ